MAILSTGDEVAEPGDARKPGQIYDSNRFALRGLVEAAGAAVADTASCPTSSTSSARACSRPPGSADVVLTSGGVSVGDYDLVKAVLQDAGASTSGRSRCSRAVRSRSAASGARTSSACPATPSPRMLTFHLFVRPALWKLAGRRELVRRRVPGDGDGADAARRSAAASSSAAS